MLATLGGSPRVMAQDLWYQTVVFENSVSTASYFYTAGKVNAPSALELINKKLPIDTSSFVSGPNSLRLHWQSKPGGGWDVELRLMQWPNRYINFTGDSLYLWLYSAKALPATALPQLTLRDSTNAFTNRLPLRKFAQDLPAGKWTRVRVPLANFHSMSVRPFEVRHVNTLIFSQGETDGVEHTLLLDDVFIENKAVQRAPAPAAPKNLRAQGFERHVELTWTPVESPSVAQYVIYRSMRGGPFRMIGVQRPGVHRYEDFVGDPHFSARYKVTARTSALRESPTSGVAEASTHPMNDDELLSMVQQASFQYYWDGAEPHSGLARESIPGGDDIVAIGGSGFGLMSMIVAADRGFVPRTQIVQRLLHITDFLAKADRFHGVWPHYLNGMTGKVLPVFGVYDDGGDLVETSFLMQGLLAVRGYFTHDDPAERRLRDQITELWKGVEWDWYTSDSKDALYWHSSPTYGFHIAHRLEGWNETMITYMLAIASPTHPVPASFYSTGFAAEGNPSHVFGKGQVIDGIPVAMNYSPGSAGPLFFTHYSFMGYDPRNVRDKYANYFVNNRNESLVQQKHAIENPKHFEGYGADTWGYSAVTGPIGYREYRGSVEDDGTIAPTAAAGAYVYTPQESLLAIKHFYRDLGAQVWDVYGFRNAFNQTQDWYAPTELALNQGPQVVMIENGRTGLIWHSFMSNPEIRAMQKAIGLQPDPEPQQKYYGTTQVGTKDSYAEGPGKR
ncbi:glucoamylase family protein [Edaphobacter bradus]|uniref:glucoamylase family protein n=1 Tax=Edaphobacter bradus TaxID=2259016 RepID=UPI0021DFCD6D|nr:glucoamylase family protein [Edaphobacter bradus]